MKITFWNLIFAYKSGIFFTFKTNLILDDIICKVVDKVTIWFREMNLCLGKGQTFLANLKNTHVSIHRDVETNTGLMITFFTLISWLTKLNVTHWCYFSCCTIIPLKVGSHRKRNGPDSSVGRVSASGNGRSRVRSRAARYQSRKKWY